MYFYKYVFLQIFQTKTIDRKIDKQTQGGERSNENSTGSFLQLVRGIIKNIFRWLFCGSQAQNCRFSSLENPSKKILFANLFGQVC